MRSKIEKIDIKAMPRLLRMFICVCGCSLGVMSPAWGQSELSLRAIKRIDQDWHMTLPLPKPAAYSVFTLADPHRLVIDILDPNLRPKTCAVRQRPVLRCRMGRLNNDRARFVLDLAEAVRVKNVRMDKSYRRYALKFSFTRADSSNASAQQFKRTIRPIAPHRKKHTRPVIVIDPGHGGALDPGASFGGADEKDLVLIYARALKMELEARLGAKVHLTRAQDRHVSLNDRVLMARRLHADLVISLHADWNADPNVKGIAVYSLSNYSADKYARRFMEDDAPQIVGGEEWQDAMTAAHDILFDVTQRQTLGRSIALSRHILKQVRHVTPVLDQPHRFADFHLLSAPELPAVLIELGFLSNAQDRRKLNSAPWRRQICRQIVMGVKNYFAQLAELKARAKK